MKFVATAVILFLLAGHPAEALPAVPSVDNSNRDQGRAKRSTGTQGVEIYGNSTYMYLPVTVNSFNEAKEKCKEALNHSNVVHIDNDLENKWILERTKHYEGGNIFIRLPDERRNLPLGTGGWAYKTGEEGNPTCDKDNPCEPNNLLGDEICYEMLVTNLYDVYGGQEGKWNDISCTLQRNVWCERGVERYGNSTYMYLPDTVTSFYAAREKCKEALILSDVVYIDNDQENSWILERTQELADYDNKEKNNIFIRLPDERRNVTNGTGGWAGTPGKGEPNNLRGDEICYEMLVTHLHGYTGQAGRWNDDSCKQKYRSFNVWCERDPETWFYHPCGWYKWMSEPLNYYEARDECIKLGGYLAIPSSEEETLFFSTTTAKLTSSDQKYWLDIKEYCPDNPDDNSNDQCRTDRSYWCEREPDFHNKETTCYNTYPVSLDRFEGPYAYRIHNYKNMSMVSNLADCQAQCNKDEDCRSLTYYVDSYGYPSCSTFKIRLGGLLGTERDFYIQRHDADKSTHRILISYDRDCKPGLKLSTTTTTTTRPIGPYTLPWK